MAHPRVSLRNLSLLVVAALAVAALVVFGLASSRGREGRPAPALPREVLSGAPVTLAALHGRPALVVFWASWCTPCAEEAPELEHFAQTLHGRAELVGVNTSDPVLADARTFIRHYRWTFPNLRDSEGTVGAAYGIANLPTTFLLDSDGRVRATLQGPQTQQTLTAALLSVGSSAHGRTAVRHSAA